MLLIATKPGRTVKKSKNSVQKYAVVQSDGKFKFTSDPNQATQFRNASDLLYAVGIRARTLVNGSRKVGVTRDLTWAHATLAGVSISKIANGEG